MSRIGLVSQRLAGHLLWSRGVAEGRMFLVAAGTCASLNCCDRLEGSWQGRLGVRLILMAWGVGACRPCSSGSFWASFCSVLLQKRPYVNWDSGIGMTERCDVVEDVALCSHVQTLGELLSKVILNLFRCTAVCWSQGCCAHGQHTVQSSRIFYFFYLASCRHSACREVTSCPTRVVM